MANSETGRVNIGISERIARKFSTGVLGHTILRAEVTNSDHSIDRMRKLLKDGYGGMVLINHWSLKDPATIIDVLFSLKDFRDRKFVAPVAYHWDYSFLREFFKANGVTSMPIVTESTIENEKNDGLELNHGRREYFDKSIEFLQEGQIVVFAPQGTRMDHLGDPNKPTVGAFMATAKQKGLTNHYAFLIAAIGIKGEKVDYSKKSGLNLSDKYTVKFSSCLKDEEVLAAAGGKFRNVDQVFYDVLRPHLHPNLR